MFHLKYKLIISSLWYASYQLIFLLKLITNLESVQNLKLLIKLTKGAQNFTFKYFLGVITMINLKKLICTNLSLKIDNLKFVLIDSKSNIRDTVTFQTQNFL